MADGDEAPKSVAVDAHAEELVLLSGRVEVLALSADHGHSGALVASNRRRVVRKDDQEHIQRRALLECTGEQRPGEA